MNTTTINEKVEALEDENDVEITNEENIENIIVQVIENEEPNKEKNSNQKKEEEEEEEEDNTVQDSPDLILIKNLNSEYELEEDVENNTGEEADSMILCETLYETETSNDFKSMELNNADGELLSLVQTESPEGNIIPDIPNDILVFTCQPEIVDNALKTFPCKTCGMAAGCIFCLKSHYESVHLNLGLIQYKCDQMTYLKNYTEICHKCNLVCESQEEMIEHRKIHFVSCDVCDMSFDSALFLSNHCKVSHEKFEVIISCDLCEQWFKQLQDLSDHYEGYHDMILCIVCFKRFPNRLDLIQHHGTHKIVLGDVKPLLPYACSKCNQAFSEISELSSHLVRDHPNRKVAYGSLVQRKLVGAKQKKQKLHFDDCGGLRQDIVAYESEKGAKKVKKSKRGRNS